jgi:hypothetical protein
MRYAREPGPRGHGKPRDNIALRESRWVPKKAPVYRGGEIIAWKVVAS